MIEWVKTAKLVNHTQREILSIQMPQSSEKHELIIDLHEDVAEYCMAEGERNKEFSKDIEGRQADFPKYKRAGVGIVVASLFPLIRTYNPELSEQMTAMYGGGGIAYTAKAPTAIALEQLKIYSRMTEAFPNTFHIIQHQTDLERSAREEQLGFLICLEGTEPLEDPSDLETFRKLGLRAIGLTWNYDTRYAASCMSKKDYGLTGDGEELVKKANEKGIIVDLAHSSKTTMLDVLNLAREPVMISHSNYALVQPHARNTDDNVLEALKQNGGVIGFTFVTSTLGTNPELDTVTKHILSVQDRYGSDILAIGTDYLGISTTPTGLENIGKLPNLITRLADLGMNKRDIRKLAWENAYRVFEENAKRWQTR